MPRGSRRVEMTPAYLLHQRPYRDTSRILEMLTRDHGRLTLFARAVSGSKTGLAGILQAFQPIAVSYNGRGEAANLTHAELIWYDRPDEEGLRTSTYRRVEVPNAGALHAALESALGIRGEVRKRREVWHWHNVRVHLDLVSALGTFLEFEALIDATSDEAISLVRLETIGRALGLEGLNDVAGSYADLLGI